MSRYLPHTDRDRAAMLDAIGVGSIDELFSDIPDEVRLKRPLRIPGPLSETELVRLMKELASKNSSTEEYTCFLGGGAYDHYVPSAISHVLSRGEFFTAYTPYQAEVSQGVLQSIYEYQTLVCQLTGMDVSNASLYDGATATAEAYLLSVAANRRERVVISRTVHPEYRRVLRTYLSGKGIEPAEVPFEDGATDAGEPRKAVDGGTTCVIAQHPNFFGLLEPVDEIAGAAHDAGALFAVAVDPISLGVLKPPSEYGADIAFGEGQSLGGSLSFGGPYLGFFACRDKYVRRMAGRIAGATVDGDGNRGFVLTLQTREQHIRRERATSNICSNEALCALAATVYLSLLGPQGISKVASLCARKAHYLYDKICRLDRFEPAFQGPFFKEFCVRSKIPAADVQKELLSHKILGGLDVRSFYPELEGDHLLFCATEKRTKEEMDYLAARLEGSI